MKRDNRSFPGFITVEGGEGAGKTTLIEILVEELTSRGMNVVRTREPGGTALGNEIRGLLLNKEKHLPIIDKAELLLFLAARAQHIEEVIAPAIATGKTVVCDRFNDSTVAYQGAARGLGTDYVRSLCNQVCGDVLPSLTFYLDVDPSIGLQRTRRAAKENASVGEVDRIESEAMEFHTKVREAFLSMARSEPERFVVIDASGTLATVSEALIKAIAARFEPQHHDV